jgi:Domain of unknown function (DUF5069)
MTVLAPDLTRAFPRSPREKMGNYFHLARMADKARSKSAGTQGEYIYPCPLDRLLLEFLEIGDGPFFEAARQNDDDALLSWVLQNAKGKSPQEIEEWNRAFVERRPDREDSKKHFLEIRNRIAPHRTDVTTWVDLLDLEEGRPVPARH